LNVGSYQFGTLRQSGLGLFEVVWVPICHRTLSTFAGWCDHCYALRSRAVGVDMRSLVAHRVSTVHLVTRCAMPATSGIDATVVLHALTTV